MLRRTEYLRDMLEDVNDVSADGEFGSLGDEVIVQILSYLKPKELGRVRRVSKRLYRVAADDVVSQTCVGVGEKEETA